MLFNRADHFRHHAIDGLIGVGQGDHGTEGIAISELQVYTPLLQQVRHNLAVGAGAVQRQHHFGRVVHQQGRTAPGDLTPHHTQPRYRAQACARIRCDTDGVAQQLLAAVLQQAAGAVDRGKDSA